MIVSIKRYGGSSAGYETLKRIEFDLSQGQIKLKELIEKLNTEIKEGYKKDSFTYSTAEVYLNSSPALWLDRKDEWFQLMKDLEQKNDILDVEYILKNY